MARVHIVITEHVSAPPAQHTALLATGISPGILTRSHIPTSLVSPEGTLTPLYIDPLKQTTRNTMLADCSPDSSPPTGPRESKLVKCSNYFTRIRPMLGKLRRPKSGESRPSSPQIGSNPAEGCRSMRGCMRPLHESSPRPHSPTTPTCATTRLLRKRPEVPTPQGRILDSALPGGANVRARPRLANYDR